MLGTQIDQIEGAFFGKSHPVMLVMVVMVKMVTMGRTDRKDKTDI